MPNRVSKFTNTLKQLGDIQVNDWDFMGLLNKDISEIDIGRSLRKLGNVRVMEWDFRTVMPAVTRLAQKEVDLVDIFKRTARYKVMEWDFRSVLSTSAQKDDRLPPEEMQALMVRLKDFLQYVAVSLIDEPDHAQIKVREIAPKVLHFELVMVQRNVSTLIGHGGHTASAIRSLMKAAAGTHGVHALLEILSHENEMTNDFDHRDGNEG